MAHFPVTVLMVFEDSTASLVSRYCNSHCSGRLVKYIDLLDCFHIWQLSIELLWGTSCFVLGHVATILRKLQRRNVDIVSAIVFTFYST